MRNFAGVFMTTISATAPPSIADTLAQLISGGSGGSPTPAATNAAAFSTAPSTGPGPAIVVTLSDPAKAAAKAQSDQVAADRLQAYVQRVQDNAAAANRVNGTGTKTNATDSLQSILDTNNQPAGTSPADPQPATGSAKVAAIVAQIHTLANADQPAPFQPFTPTKSLSNSVTVDGYTLSLSTNASTQFYGIELSGNGVQEYNKHFGPCDGAGGGSGKLPPGVEISGQTGVNNNEALDSITITQNLATASSASASSSSAGSISTSSVSAQSSSITFQVNYATGQISVAQSAESVSARSTSVAPPGSTLSTLA
jgi:hypothetical protein